MPSIFLSFCLWWAGGGLWLYLDSRGLSLQPHCPRWWATHWGWFATWERDQHSCRNPNSVPEWAKTEIQTLPPTTWWGYHWGEIKEEVFYLMVLWATYPFSKQNCLYLWCSLDKKKDAHYSIFCTTKTSAFYYSGFIYPLKLLSLCFG